MRRRAGAAAVAAWIAAAAGCGGSTDPSRTGSSPGSLPAQGGGDPPAGGGGGDPPSTGPSTGGPSTGVEPPPAIRPDALEVTYRETRYQLLAVGADGTAYGHEIGEPPEQLWASADGRAWTPRGALPAGRSFFVIAPLRSGTLLADTKGPDGHALSRSTDGGRSWSDVLALGSYRLLTPRSVAELGGEVLVLEYQAFSGAPVPIRLWASADDGSTWAVRSETAEHRHGHGLLADPDAGALWLFYGDLAGGTYLSFDGGATATLARAPLEGGVLVSAAVTGDGLLGGLDTLWSQLPPAVVSLSLSGAYDRGAPLPGPSYSIHALRGGGYLVGAAREPDGDVYPDDSAHLLASADGRTFQEVFACPRLDPLVTARADVYFQLADGEPVVQVVNCDGFGAGGVGYALLGSP
ncbi:WD40/YVTN/BNR-like repeat-containing protein [Anaeromyxobacter oryzisoli]|uniref:WD40/YVTN/BNR-like repeat-containing protein n=1 Tax=Anaeromyxobacter oryzisoli TaxID=2925408 RepID=UPI001F5A65F8|nr:sialidase family protein [Anaeromyxobacter sp. SG63]